MKKVIVAIDSFKGCMSSKEANQAAAKSMPDAQVIQIPVSDGGEGWLEAFQSAMGGEPDPRQRRRRGLAGGIPVGHGRRVSGDSREGSANAAYRN